MIPVIDVFAGPGGPGEGFVSLGRREGRQRFKGTPIYREGLGCASNSETACVFPAVLQLAGTATLLRCASRPHFA